MEHSERETVSVVEDLIRTLDDSAEGLRSAAEHVKDSEANSRLLEFSVQRSRFAQELRDSLDRLGATEGRHEKEGGTLGGKVRRGWMDLKSALGGGDSSILNEAEREEDRIKDQYDEALGSDLPGEIRAIVERQSAEVHQAHDQVRAMRDQMRRAA